MHVLIRTNNRGSDELCSDRQVLDLALKNSDSPLFIFTDGGSQKADHARGAANSAAIVVCKPNVHPNEKFGDGKWQKRPPIPLIARIQPLPDNFGTSPTDNGHAEMIAMNMAEEILPTYLPAVIVTDSEVTLNRYKLLRDGNIGTDRHLIRNVLSGISKSCTNRLLLNLSLWSRPSKKAHEDGEYKPMREPEHIDYDDMLDQLHGQELVSRHQGPERFGGVPPAVAEIRTVDRAAIPHIVRPDPGLPYD